MGHWSRARFPLLRVVRDEIAGTARAVDSLTRAGVIRPVRLDRLAGMTTALARYGFTLTAGYVAGAGRHPERAAIVDDDGTLPFGELHARTDRLAAAFATTGVGPAARVGVLYRNHRGPVEVQVAVGKLGAEAVLLNTGLSTAGLGEVARELALHTVVADAEFADALADLPAHCARVVAHGAGSRRSAR